MKENNETKLVVYTILLLYNQFRNKFFFFYYFGLCLALHESHGKLYYGRQSKQCRFWLDTLRVMFGTEDFMMCTTLVSLSPLLLFMNEMNLMYNLLPHDFFFFFFYLVVTRNPITINSYL